MESSKGIWTKIAIESSFWETLDQLHLNVTQLNSKDRRQRGWHRHSVATGQSATAWFFKISTTTGKWCAPDASATSILRNCFMTCRAVIWPGGKKKRRAAPLSQAGTTVLVPSLRDKQTPWLNVWLYEGTFFFIALTITPLPAFIASPFPIYFTLGTQMLCLHLTGSRWPCVTFSLFRLRSKNNANWTFFIRD